MVHEPQGTQYIVAISNVQKVSMHCQSGGPRLGAVKQKNVQEMKKKHSLSYLTCIFLQILLIFIKK